MTPSTSSSWWLLLLDMRCRQEAEAVEST